MRLLGCLEVGSGWCFDALHVAGVDNFIADNISRWKEVIDDNLNASRPDVAWRRQVLGPTGVELCSGILAASLSASLLRLCLKRLIRRVSGLDRFSGVDRGSPIFRRGRLVDGENPGVARVCRVVWCVGGQPGRYYCQSTRSSVVFPPCRCADGVDHVVTIDKTCAERGRAVARWRRHLEKSPPPCVVGHFVGRTVFGPVVGSGPPRSVDVSRVELFFRGAVGRNFASASGVGHLVQCLTRGDVAQCRGAAVGLVAGTRPPASRFVSAATRMIKPDKGRSSCSRVTTPGGHVPG